MKDAYRIMELVRRGTLGPTYRAEVGQRSVCVRLFRVGADELAASRARTEALQLIDSPLLVHPERWLRMEGQQWVVLPWIPGNDLDEIQAPVPDSAAIDVLRQVADALGTLASTEADFVWPPDLRPSRVRVTADGDVALTGAWLPASPRFLDVRSQWWPPEGVDGNRDKAAVYALGVLLFWLLRGEPLGVAERQARAHALQVQLAVDSLDRGTQLIPLLTAMLSFKAAARPWLDQVREVAEALRATTPGPTLSEWMRDHPEALARPEGADADGRIGATLVAEQQGDDDGDVLVSILDLALERLSEVPPATRISDRYDPPLAPPPPPEPKAWAPRKGSETPAPMRTLGAPRPSLTPATAPPPEPAPELAPAAAPGPAIPMVGIAAAVVAIGIVLVVVALWALP